MKSIQVKKLDFKKITGVKNLKKIKKRNTLLIKNSYTKGFKKENDNDKKKEEVKMHMTAFNKIFNDKKMSRRKTKEISFKLNNIVDDIKKEDDNDYENHNEVKKLIRNFSSITKKSTMYETKKKFFSSKELSNTLKKKEEEKPRINFKRRSYMERKIERSMSANNDKNNNNSFFGGSQFITALNPVYFNGKKMVSENKSNKSYFFNKIKSEKKFLTYFDIKKIYFLDQKVYKPNKKFENAINRLKRNNSHKFLMRFNLDSYKMTIMNLFQKHVCHQNFDIMKKNFELINKAWKWKDNLKCHHVRKKKNSISQTEREMKYKQYKIERENKIKNRNINKNKKEKKSESPL
jgi:hypothetical protein